MGKKIYIFIAAGLLTLLSVTSQANALSIADNRELYSEALDPSEIVAVHDMNYLTVSLRYQVREAGSFKCDDSAPSVCDFVEGPLSNHSEKVRGKAVVYELKDGKKILSIKAQSSQAGLGTISIEQEYVDALISNKKRAKIVTSGTDFAYGTNLNTNFMDFRQRSRYLGAREQATIGSLRLSLSTPRRNIGFAHWRDAGNLQIRIMTYNRI